VEKSGSSPQQVPDHSSPTKEVQAATAGKPDSTSTDKSEYSGTNNSGNGTMTRQKAAMKRKVVKEVTEAKDPEAKAKQMRATACLKKEKEQQELSKAKEQDKDEVELSNNPQPKSLVTNAPSKSPVTTPEPKSPTTTLPIKSLVTSPKSKLPVTTPNRPIAFKPSASTPSDLSKSDSSGPKTTTPVKSQEQPTKVSQLLPITDIKGLNDVNNLLDNFLSRGKAKKKKSPAPSPKSTTSSMEEHITSVAKKVEENKNSCSSPERNAMKDPFGGVVKPPKTMDRISPNGEGRMSLKPVEECADEVTEREYKKSLEAKGIKDEDAFPGIFLPNEVEAAASKEGTNSLKTTGISEFAKDLYAAAGVYKAHCGLRCYIR